MITTEAITLTTGDRIACTLGSNRRIVGYVTVVKTIIQYHHGVPVVGVTVQEDPEGVVVFQRHDERVLLHPTSPEQ